MQLSQLKYMLQKVMVKLIGKSESVPKLLLPKRTIQHLCIVCLQDVPMAQPQCNWMSQTSDWINGHLDMIRLY